LWRILWEEYTATMDVQKFSLGMAEMERTVVVGSVTPREWY
jgi:hypothetical protein